MFQAPHWNFYSYTRFKISALHDSSQTVSNVFDTLVSCLQKSFWDLNKETCTAKISCATFAVIWYMDTLMHRSSTIVKMSQSEDMSRWRFAVIPARGPKKLIAERCHFLLVHVISCCAIAKPSRPSNQKKRKQSYWRSSRGLNGSAWLLLFLAISTFRPVSGEILIRSKPLAFSVVRPYLSRKWSAALGVWRWSP